MEKTRIRQAILDRLTADLATLTRAAEMARDEATHEESRPESKYDTHSQEAAYLAEGQARLAAELRDSLAAYHALALRAFAPGDAIDLGAVVTLESGRRTARYFLGPRNGGLEFPLDGETLLLITPQSPLGRLLVGRRAGDTLALPGRGGAAAQHRILSVG